MIAWIRVKQDGEWIDVADRVFTDDDTILTLREWLVSVGSQFPGDTLSYMRIDIGVDPCETKKDADDHH